MTEYLSAWRQLNQKTVQLEQQGIYNQATIVAEQALDLARQHLSSESDIILTSLTNLAILYSNQRRYSDAELLYQEALEISKRLLGGEEHPNVADILNSLAKLHQYRGQYLEAESLHAKALDIYVRLVDQWDSRICRDAIMTLSDLSNVYFEQGRYEEAKKFRQDVLEMGKRLLGEDDSDIGAYLQNLAIVHHVQGEYSEAESLYLEALEISNRSFGEGHPETAFTLLNLTEIYRSQGRYSEAEQLCLNALEVNRNIYGNQYTNVVTKIQNSLGLIYLVQGRYSEAETIFLKILDINRRILGEEHIEVAANLNNLAEIYREQGRYSEAESLCVKALDINRRILGIEHPMIPTGLNNLGLLNYLQERYSEAELLLQEALEIYKRLLGEDHPEITLFLNNLGEIYCTLGRFSEAKSLYDEALSINQRLHREEHPIVAVILNNLATLFHAEGRYPEAEQIYTKALQKTKHAFGENHPHVGLNLSNLANFLAATDRYEDAFSRLLEALQIEDETIDRIFAFSSESDRLAYLQTIRGNMNGFLSLIHKYFPESPQAIYSGLELVLKRKAITMSALASQNQALFSGRYSHLMGDVQKLRDLSEQIIDKTFSFTGIDSSVSYQEELANLQTKYNILQKELAAQVPEIQLQKHLIDYRKIATALPKDSVLVEFVRSNVYNFQVAPTYKESGIEAVRYLAFVLPAQQPDAVRMIPLPEDAEFIGRKIQELRSSAADSSEESLGMWQSDSTLKLNQRYYNKTAAIQLTQVLFYPLREAVSGYKHLIIAPDGDLNLVPFQILPFDETGCRLLTDEFCISYLDVGREILRYQVQSNRPAFSPLVIADPNFDLGEEVINEPSSEILEPVSELLNSLKENRLSRVPSTYFLGKSVANKLKGVELYLGNEALESRLMSDRCPKIMLIATHGLFLPDPQYKSSSLVSGILSDKRFFKMKLEDPMLRTGLALAGANSWLLGGTPPSGAGKGFVFAQEIAGLDLWANELTVLSACNTARGDIRIGEGVFGLRRAFAVAGTKTLVMSLWEVPGRATALLMDYFFDNLKSGLGRAEALREAQNYVRTITIRELRQSPLGLEVLKELFNVQEFNSQVAVACSEDEQPLQHPFYWGAWICQGDTTPLTNVEWCDETP
ncbi:CHAT domain-containing tetratricopeptide repeat protein [Fischerella sp. PCC 9605]|uniref:CHAT domain-containing tetratricopeptide repeat protein n=1 Tax=Fischerella sp. PCC 9605 TaxID=1173024 RepID=UPI0004792382|nr:CHAT domain-containing tetratricopeptide repeat protein [Fischerella sp. PCC 9605]